VDRSQVAAFIAEHGVKAVRVSFADLHGVARGRTVPARAFVAEVLEDGMEMSNAVFAMDTAGGIALGTSIPMDIGFPNWRMIPDLDTFGPVGGRPGEARVLADVVDPGGAPVEVAPRTVLQRQVERLARRGWHGRAAPEVEFYLFHARAAGGPPQPVMTTVQYNSELKHAAMSPILSPVLAALEEEGHEVEALGQEYSPSQYELNFRHRPILEAADRLFTAKATLKEVLAAEGYLATFMPKPLAQANGSGCHVHLSLYDGEGHNLFSDPASRDGLSDLCRRFIGGLLFHAGALFCLTNPTVNCYKRVVPGRFAPVNVTWGYDNRTCLVRVPRARGEATHIEFRAPSAIANPYITLAAVLAAGLDGVERGLDPGPATGGDAYQDRTAARLPGSLPEALRALAADDALMALIGPTFCQDFLAIKAHEAERFAHAVTDWEWDEYLDMY
jgi:glutamine synthetase